MLETFLAHLLEFVVHGALKYFLSFVLRVFSKSY